jgi:hypothetical protein
MAYTLVDSLRRNGCGMPVRVLAQDYAPGLRWRGLAEVRPARGCYGGKDDLRWLNKLQAMAETPFEETIFLDADLVAAADISSWFDTLGTDDFSFWNQRCTPENSPDEMRLNYLNPHVFCPTYGMAEMPVILGGGHYFLRQGARGEAVLQRMAELMQEASEDAACEYWRLAGWGNFISDETAATMAAAEFSLLLPPPSQPATAPISQLLPPYQQWLEADFTANRLRLLEVEASREVVQQVVHFANCGKSDASYQSWIKQVLTKSVSAAASES